MTDILPQFLILMLALASSNANFRTDAIERQVGTLRLGQHLSQSPRNITNLRYCLGARNWTTCEVKLPDGVWYRFEAGTIVSKAVSVRGAASPSWIAPNESPQRCRMRLERLLLRKFRLSKDDEGNPEVISELPLRQSGGSTYNLIVHYERRRMSEIYLTNLGDPDA